MRVLLVEDTADLRVLFARLLKAHGFLVREAQHGQEALDCLDDFDPDLVITDIMMPVMDGVELIRRLRGIPALAAIPIVAITADGTAETERRAREAGAVDLIIKPVDIGALIGRLYGPGGVYRSPKP